MPALTTAAVEKYKPHESARREIPDTKAPGLRLVIQPKPTGAKSWIMQFRRPDKRTAKLKLGPVDFSGQELKDVPVLGQPLSLAAARALAATINRERAMGVDVIEKYKAERSRIKAVAAERASNTFGGCAREYFAEHKTRKHGTRPRRWHEDAALLGLRWSKGCDPKTTEPELVKGGLSDIWVDKPVAEIDGHDIHTVVDEARKAKGGSNSRARHRFRVLSSMFSWLVRERRVSSNPCSNVWRPAPPPPRDRLLSDSEIIAFWKACDRIEMPYGPMFKILLLSGARLREVAEMRRAELVTDGVWLIPGARTKNHNLLSLPLPKLARDIIAEVPVIGDDFVFTVSGERPVSGFSHAKSALDAALKETAGHVVPDWRLHDLRRTAASGMAKLGVQLPVIEKILNHTSGSFGGIVGVYQRHEFMDEKRDALQRWADHIVGLVEGRPDNVVQLKAR